MLYTTNAPININPHALYPLPGMGAWRHGGIFDSIKSQFPHPQGKLLHQLPTIIIGPVLGNLTQLNYALQFTHAQF